MTSQKLIKTLYFFINAFLINTQNNNHVIVFFTITCFRYHFQILQSNQSYMPFESNFLELSYHFDRESSFSTILLSLLFLLKSPVILLFSFDPSCYLSSSFSFDPSCDFSRCFSFDSSGIPAIIIASTPLTCPDLFDLFFFVIF